MKIVIAGSRNFNDYDFLENKINELIKNKQIDITEIVSGKAKGADFLGEKYASLNNISIKEFPANWNLYGKKAGFLRNQEMGNYADVLIAFWDGNSKGTKHMIDYMRNLKKQVFVFNFNKQKIKYIENGNIFNSSCEFLINPVNTVGVMGKGLALQFKNLFPNNFLKYRQHCLNGNLTIGKLLITTENNKKIINFPTKEDWKNPSKLEYIILGLEKLETAINKFNIKSIAFPKIGAGLGGLNWNLVLEEIKKFHQRINPNVIIEIYI